MRLFFNVSDGTEQICDPTGIEVSSPEEGRAQALLALEEFREESRVLASDLSGWRLSVTDGAGAVVLTLNLDKLDLN